MMITCTGMFLLAGTYVRLTVFRPGHYGRIMRNLVDVNSATFFPCYQWPTLRLRMLHEAHASRCTLFVSSVIAVA